LCEVQAKNNLVKRKENITYTSYRFYVRRLWKCFHNGCCCFFPLDMYCFKW